MIHVLVNLLIFPLTERTSFSSMYGGGGEGGEKGWERVKGEIKGEEGEKERERGGRRRDYMYMCRLFLKGVLC